MNSNNYVLRSLFAILVVFFATLTTSAKEIFYVKSGGDGDGSSWVKAFGNIQQAVDMASKKGADVWVAKGVYAKDSLSSVVLNLKPGVSIYGGFAGTESSLALRDTAANPTILDGKGTAQVIHQDSSYLKASPVVIDGFTIQNGKASNGGGLYILGNTTINNCIIKGNIASYGSAIYADNAVIKNCQIIYNGNLSNYCNYTVYLYNNSVLENCNVKYNNSRSYSAINASRSDISDCTIEGNVSGYTGYVGSYFYYSNISNCKFINSIGATAAVEIYGTSVMTGCLFKGNKDASSTLIYLGDRETVVEDCQILNNTTSGRLIYGSQGKVRRCTLKGNTVSNYMVEVYYGASISNSLICDNTCTNYYDIIEVESNASMINCTVARNTTNDQNLLYLSNAVLQNNIVVGNKTSGDQRTLMSASGDNIIVNNMILHSPSEGEDEGLKYASFKDAENGDYSLSANSYCINAGSEVVDSVDIFGNARKQKGAVDLGAIESSYASGPSIADIFYVKAGANGTGTSWASPLGDINQAIKAASIDGKKHQIWVAAGTYYGDTLSSQSAFSLSNGISLYGGFAGTETSLADRDTAKNPTILDGKNIRCVIYQNYGFSAMAPVVVDGFTIQNGRSSNGAGAYLSSNTTISNCIFKNNTGTYYGSAVYATGATIRNCQIIGNQSGSSSTYYAAYMNKCVMDGCLIKDNVSFYSCGIYASNNSEISNCTIEGNVSSSSNYKGSIFSYSKISDCKFINTSGYGSSVELQSTSVMRGCLFENNTDLTTNVVCLSDKGSLLEDCQILNCQTSAALINSKGKVNRCTIKGNTTPSNMIYVDGETSVLSNCLICGNTSSSTSDFIYLGKSSMINCTVVNNETKSSYVAYVSNGTLKNSIILGNKTSSSTASVVNLYGTTVVSHNMLENTISGGNIEGTMEYAAFKDTANGDYSLTSKSYCINGGDAVADTLDLLGNARSQNGGVDMGAIESAYDKSFIQSMPDTLYVKEGGNGDGSSWANAAGDINALVRKASIDGNKHQIWVAAGTYYGDTASSVAAINLEDGISLYGGFAGDETSLDARDTLKNRTILDGSGARSVLYQGYPFSASLAIIIDGFTIQNGDAQFGAGVYIKDNTTISNCIIKGNKGRNEGSAIYALNGRIKNSMIIGNTYYSGLKSTVYLNGASMDSCLVKGNTAYYMSGFNTLNNAKISDCTIEGNTNTNGTRGSVFKDSYVTRCNFINLVGNSASVEITGVSYIKSCLFEGNTGVRTNLVYYSGTGASYIDECQFINNSVNSTLFYQYSGTTRRCVFKGNTVTNRIVELYGSSKMYSTLICSNVSSSSSSEPVCVREKAEMTNCTVAGNETKCNNIGYVYNGVLKNSIIFGNKSGVSSNGVLNLGGSNTITNNMLEATYITGNLDGKAEYVAFKDTANGDYSLSENSYCINAGTYMYESYDLLGNARKQGGTVDMGAIESPYEKAPSFASVGEIVYVKEGADGDGSSWSSPFGDIQKAIFAASIDRKRHQIWVAAGTYTGDSTAYSVVNLMGNVSLYGGFAGNETSLADRDTAKNPTILDGQGVRRVITQAAAFTYYSEVVVDGFTIQNGKAVSGGGVYLYDYTTISNCIIRNNSATGYGSAIYATKATIKNSQIYGNINPSRVYGTVRLIGSTMDSCYVKDNKAYYYSCFYAEQSSKVTNCVFEGNVNNNGYKGVFATASAIADCRFINTNGSGCTVELQSKSTLKKSLFEGNTNVGTHMIYLNGENTVEDCQIIDNALSAYVICNNRGKVDRCVIKGNRTSNHLIDVYNTSSTISNCLICDNVCSASGYYLVYLSDKASMINCTVARNQTVNRYVAYINNSTLSNSIVVGNKRDSKYSGILSMSGTNTISNNMLESTFVDGNLDGSMEYASFVNPDSSDYSLSENSYCINAGAYTSGLDLLGNARTQGGATDMGAIESDFAKSQISAVGEIVYVKEGSNGDGSSWSSAFGNIQNAIIAASVDGKKHQIWVAAGTYTGDSTLSTVVNLASGISLYGGFAGNETSLSDRDTAANPTILDGRGSKRVITQNSGFADSMAVVVDGFTICNGYAYEGGGVYILDNTTVKNCIIKANKATYLGTAVYASNATIRNSQIVDNTYSDYADYTVRLYNCMMDSCSIVNNKTYYYASITAENSIISNCEISGNSCYSSPGGNRGSYFNSCQVSDCKFTKTDGAGATVDLQGTTVMKSCVFDSISNISTNIIYMRSANASLEDCKILNNTVSSTLLNAYGKVGRCVISGNKSSNRLIELNNSSSLMSSSLICDNICTSSYEPIYMNNGSSMINCTVVRNEGKHGNVFYMSSSTLKNSIIVGNKTDINHSSVLNLNGTGNTVKGNMLESTFLEGNVDGSMKFASFVDASAGDYSLSENSYCINTDTSAVDSLDLLGNLRIQGGAVDMGAIESAFDKAASKCGEIIYVKAGSEGDGTSWKSPFGDINEAMLAASSDGKKHQIWVAAGTYYGDTTLNAVVSLASGISLYGGFAGNETSLSARDTAANPTILDGKGVRRVVLQSYGFADSMAVVVDGFTIQNGYATYGGGLFINSNTTVSNCLIRGNKASNTGTAIYASNATIKNCCISENTYQGSPSYTIRINNCVMDSCVVKNNRAYNYGGILAENNSKVSNCELSGNVSNYNTAYYRGSYFNSSYVTDCKFIKTSGAGASAELAGSTVMKGCLFEDNTNVNTYLAYVSGSGASIEDCKFLNNTLSSTPLNVSQGKADRCILKGNSASSRILELTSSATISNSLICDNKVSNTYEPIYMYNKAVMVGCDVVNNQTPHSNVIYLYNSTLKNSIVVGNKTNANHTTVLNANGTNTIASNMLESTSLDGNINGSMRFAAFTDAANGDFSLAKNSYCINAGEAVADSLDLLGNARTQGDAVDMGAIESAHENGPSKKCGEIIYVKADAEGDGSSWESPLGDIQQAILIASADGEKHQVWVASGTYYGDTTLYSVVTLTEGISLYGGFAGNEKSLADRDTAANPTILDGKKARRVISQSYGFSDSMQVAVDGFTIQNGYSPNGGGAYLRQNTILNNCIVKNCSATDYGFAIYSLGAVISNSLITGNGALGSSSSNRYASVYMSGGRMDSCVVKGNKAYYTSGVQAESATISASLFEANESNNSPVLTLSKSYLYDCQVVNNNKNSNIDNTVKLQTGSIADRCKFDGNNSYGHNVYVYGSSVISNSQITNCTSRGNGIVYLYDKSKMINCTVADCQSNSQSVHCNSGTQMLNSIVVGNKRTNKSESVYVNGATITYSMIEGGANGEGNIDGSRSSASFADPSNGDYSLSQASLCINAGTEVTDSLDMLRGVRKQSESVDMGAIESPYTERAVVGPIIYVKSGAEGSGLGWDDAVGEISQAISLASSAGGIHQVWVAAGSYIGDTSLISAISLVPGVSLYGGFAGTEQSLSEREIEKNATIINGKYKRRCIIQNYDFADSLAIVVDGFTVQSGAVENVGVNVKSKKGVTFRNCTFKNANSGNESVYAEKSSFVNCTFADSKVQYLEIYGGVVDSCTFADFNVNIGQRLVYIDATKMSNSQISGVTNNYGVLEAVNNSIVNGCRIMNNVSTYQSLIRLAYSRLDNSYVYGNAINNTGNSIISADYTSYVTNSTVAHNTTRNRSALSYTYSTSGKFATVANSIIYGNKVSDDVRPQVVKSDYVKVKYCASDGDLYGENNIKLATANSGSDESQNYVCFINAAGGDYRLHATSSCIDKGLDSIMTAATDINGSNRIYGKAIDLGASEYDGEYEQMLDYYQVICHNRPSLEASFDSTISKIDWKVSFAGNVTGFDSISGSGATIPAMQLATSKSDIDTLTLKVTSYDKSGVAGTTFNYNYYVYPDFSSKKVVFARPQVAYVVNEQNTNMTIEWRKLNIAVPVDNYDLYVWKSGETMPSEPKVSYVKESVYSMSGLDNHTTYKYMVKAAIACDTVCSDIDSFRIDIPVSLEVIGNVNCVFGSKLNETTSLTRMVKGFELTDSISYTISGKDAADFAVKVENGWNKLTGGYLRIFYTPTDVKKQNSDAEITIKSGSFETTLYLAGTLSNYYMYDAVVGKDVYYAGDTVDVIGILTDAYGSPIEGKTLTIEANSQTGYAHSATATTDTAGLAHVKFATSKSECGTYSVKVYAGSADNTVRAQFDIPGVAYSGGTTKWTIQKGDTVTGSITVANRSAVDLHNLVVETRDLADGLVVEFDTLALLKGDASGRISFKATGIKLTEGKMYLPSIFRISADENATCDFTTYFYCEHPYGQIKVMPTSINEYVSKQKAKTINFELTNAGFGETGEITLSVPDFAGFNVPSTTLPSIKAGDTVYVPLKISYYAGAPINVPFTGSIGVNCANGKSTSVPFRVEYSSESKGGLEVDVVDEYYYNTADKKHLSGAKVVLRNQYNNKEVASGISDSTGKVRFDSIPEGSYLMSVKADKHSEYQETIEIQAGQVLDKFVFLAYQAITYTWNVERVEIEDRYDIKLDLEYETNIPAPVVTITFPNGVPDKSRFEVGVPKNVRLQITNHGLIAAKYVKFGMPKSPYYRFYAPYNYIDSLPASHTEFINVTIVRTSYEYPSASDYEIEIKHGYGTPLDDDAYGTSECPNVHAEYSYECGILRQLSAVSENAWGCPTLIPLGGGYAGGGGGWAPSYGGNNGGTYDGNVVNNGHAVNWDLPCNSCQSKIDPWGCIGNVLGYIPGVGPVLEWTTGMLHDAIKEGEEERRKAMSCEVPAPEEDKPWYDNDDLDSDFQINKDTPEELKKDYEKMKAWYNMDVAGIKGDDDDNDDKDPFISASFNDMKTIAKGTELVCKGVNGELDPYEGMDFVWDQGKSLFDNKVKIPKIGAVPWDCIDLLCQVASCEAGRYAENCGRYLYDRFAGNDEEDEDTRKAVTSAGDTVVIENGQIKDVLYPNGDSLSSSKGPKEVAKAQANFNLKNSIYKTADAHMLAVQDAVEYTGMLHYRGELMQELAGSEDLLSIDGIIDYFDYTVPSITKRKMIVIDSIKALPAKDLSTTQMVELAERWNRTLEANEKGILAPNEQYPDIIDQSVVNAYMDSIVNFYTYMMFRGYDLVTDMLVDINKEANQPTQKSVCASIKLQISQTLTMTREAFDGTLTVNNGSESGAMEGFKVVLEIRNDKGEIANDLFQINTEKLTGISSIDGDGEIAPKSEGTALFRFIPEKGAAPQAPENYSFGGYLVYVDPSTGDTVKADLYPVTLTVNPSPDLQIDYFMQRNILGDDALTLDRVEPSVPAALGVRIDNQGYGMAKNVKLETAQPEIVENQKGLKIDFEIIGSSLDGKDCDLGSENIDFGNIDALSTKTGVWWMTASLLGHFTKYEASVVHANSFGNPELSLVKGVAIHELIKTVEAYDAKADGVVDFLVNDYKDAKDTPDAIYYSNGGKDTVKKAQSTKLDKKMVMPNDTVVKLTVLPSEAGWNYAQMDDPGCNLYDIKKVVRLKDSVEIPLNNVWTTFVTLLDGQEPVYENRLHFLDYITSFGDNDYDIYYSLKRNQLNVTEIAGAPAEDKTVTSPVDSVVVKFSRKIKKETFDYNDIELYCQAGDNLSDSTITVEQRGDYTYVVNIASKTKVSGMYKMEVNVNNVLDEDGFAGVNGKGVAWNQFIENPDTTSPVVPDTIVPVNPDTITPVNPDTITPVNPDTITPVNPDTITPVNPDTITPVNPDTITPVNPDTITPVNPDTITPVNPDTSDFTTHIVDLDDDELIIYANENCVYVKATKAGSVDIYDILSRLVVKNAQYDEGVTMIAILPKGVYIIKGKKVIVR